MVENSTPRPLRCIITLIGCRNVGKSSLINALAGQEVAIVSSHPGTTTDAVAKPYELLPLGPIIFYDTAGLDDEGELGNLRIKATRKILYKSDMVLIVTSHPTLTDVEKNMIAEVQKLQIPFIIVYNKSDVTTINSDNLEFCHNNQIPCIAVSATTGNNIDKLKDMIVANAPIELTQDPLLIGDLLTAGNTILMVTPIDSGAPKGRLILPQVQILREILDCNATATVTKENELASALANLKNPPALVITDSQVVRKVATIVPDNIPLTTFSTAFARNKGDISILYQGAEAIDNLKDGDSVLIAEACSHHVQTDDIGKVKIPNWIRQYTGRNLQFEFSAGCDFPDNLEKYALVIHCGACMLNRTEMVRRLKECVRRGVPITNYGIAISKTQGVLARIIAPFTNELHTA